MIQIKEAIVNFSSVTLTHSAAKMPFGLIVTASPDYAAFFLSLLPCHLCFITFL